MTEVTVTGLQSASTCFAFSVLARSSHARVERTMRNDFSATIEIEEFAIGNFYNALANDIIIGPRIGICTQVSNINLLQEMGQRSDIGQNGSLNALHHTEFQLLDNFWHTVDDLGLAQIDLHTFWRLHCRRQEQSIASGGGLDSALNWSHNRREVQTAIDA